MHGQCFLTKSYPQPNNMQIEQVNDDDSDKAWSSYKSFKQMD